MDPDNHQHRLRTVSRVFRFAASISKGQGRYRREVFVADRIVAPVERRVDESAVRRIAVRAEGSSPPSLKRPPKMVDPGTLQRSGPDRQAAAKPWYPSDFRLH